MTQAQKIMGLDEAGSWKSGRRLSSIKKEVKPADPTAFALWAVHRSF
jgi:hypothetical protein